MSGEHAIDLFLGACGMTGPLRLDVEGPGGDGVERRAYHQPFVLIGRQAGADLQLADDQVGRRHALLQVIAGRVFCVDLASRTGVHWDGGAEGSGWLGRERAVRIGPSTVRLRGGTPGEGDRDASGEWESPLKPEALEHLGFPGVLMESEGPAMALPSWRMGGVLALAGRSPECQVRIPDANVSTFHCALVRTPVGVWAVDLLGQGGITINGRPVRWGRLGAGDELGIGRRRIRPRYDGHASGGPGPQAMLPAPSIHPPVVHGSPTATVPSWLPPVPEVKDLLAGRPPEQLELAEALVGPLMDRLGQMQQQVLGQMQQQVFDQFQQVLMAVLQMFGAMHRDQMELVHEELAQLRRITEELRAAQAKPARPRSIAQDRPGPEASDVPPSGPAAEAIARGSGAEGEGVPGPPPTSGGATAAGGEPGRGADASRRNDEDGASDLPDVHDLLARRVAALQKEQQGRWQKILNLVAGQSREGPTP